MTSIRWFLVASVLGGVAFDVVRQGSEEYACKSEIARVQQEIGLLEQRRADLRVGLEQQLLARVAETGIEFGNPIVRTEIPREPTLWERSEMREDNSQRAFASEQDPRARLSLNDWLDAQ